jgi:hypothetical protein
MQEIAAAAWRGSKIEMEFVMKNCWLIVLLQAFMLSLQVVAQTPQPAGLEQRIAAAVQEAKRGNRQAFSKVDYEMKRPEAIKYLRQYVDDSDSTVRRQVVISVRGQHSAEAIQILSDLVRNGKGLFFPEAVSSLEEYYSCKELTENKPKNLVANLIAAAKDNFRATLSKSEVRLLGCLAVSDQEARKFLTESALACENGKLVLPQFKTSQCWLLSLALAKAGNKDAVRKLLADLRAARAEEATTRLEAWIASIQYVDDRELLLALAELIRDKRPGPAPVPHLSENRIRICEWAISSFTAKLGTGVTGEKEGNSRRHSDEDLERIYQRVKTYLEAH